MYLKDAWELLKNMEKEGLEPNIHILNSMVYLYANAYRTEELEAKVLPLYDKYRINHDIYTYQHLSKLYLHTRELDTLMKLYDRITEKESFKPNKMMLDTFFEGALRLKNSDRIA
jgi:hypothetical protein